MKTFRDYLQEAEKHTDPSGVGTNMYPSDDDLDVKTGSRRIKEESNDSSEKIRYHQRMIELHLEDLRANPNDKHHAQAMKAHDDAINAYKNNSPDKDRLSKEAKYLSLHGTEPDTEIDRESMIAPAAKSGALNEDDEELRSTLRDIYQLIIDHSPLNRIQLQAIDSHLEELGWQVDLSRDADVIQGYNRVYDDQEPEELVRSARFALELLTDVEDEPDVWVDTESTELSRIKNLAGISEDDKEQKTKTKVKDADVDWGDLDDLFKPKGPSDLTAPEKPKAKDSEPEDEPEQDGDNRRRARQSDTLRATAGIAPTDRMRDLLSRMRDIDADPDDPGYPDPEPPEELPQVRVNTENLPAVAGARLQAAGVQNPDFHQVANLPGNMSRAIRTLGRALFRSLTRTPTEDVWMVGNLNGQGPNSRQEVNAVAGWVRDTGERITDGDIDFDTTIPGYTADIQQWRAAGIRWLLVRDEFGDYVYSWPERDSITAAGADRLAAPERDQPRRLGR